MDGYTQRNLTPTGSEESASKMTQATPKAATKGTKIDDIRLKPTENGGFIVTASRSPIKPSKYGAYLPSKDYSFSNLDEALDFVTSEFTGAPEAETPAEDAGGGAEDAMEMSAGNMPAPTRA